MRYDFAENQLMCRSPVSVIVNRWIWSQAAALPAARDLVRRLEMNLLQPTTGFAHETHLGVTDCVLESREHR